MEPVTDPTPWSMVRLVAFETFQDSVELAPAVMLAGEAVNEAMDGGAVPPEPLYSAWTSEGARARLYTRTSSIVPENRVQLPSPPRAPMAKASLFALMLPVAATVAALAPFTYPVIVAPS